MSEPHSETVMSGRSSIGETLQTRREELGWQIDDVADYLKIRPYIIDALERDDYEALPGRAYALGFIKNYATFLELNADEQVALLDRELLSKADKTNSPSFSVQSPHGERGVSVLVLLVVGILIVIAAYVCWYYFADHGVSPHAVTAPAVTEQKSTGGTEREGSREQVSQSSQSSQGGDVSGRDKTLSPAAHDGLPDQTPDVTPEPEETHQGSASSTSSSAGGLPATPTASAPTEGDNSSAPSPFVPSSKSQPSQENPHPAAASAAPAAHAITVRVAQDSWVQIKNAQGQVVQSRIMKKGESWQGDDSSAPYHITAGNAGGVFLQVGDITSAPLGAPGTVKHNVVVSVQDIQNGRYGRGNVPSDLVSAPSDAQKEHTSSTTVLDHSATSH